jgi:tetratricopeptide (TPR) repeat protein
MGPPTNRDRIELANLIFSQALELPPAQQEDFVRERCAGQEGGLCESVLLLLSRYGRLGDFLQEPAWPAGLAVGQLSSGEVLGGRFRIVSLLGRGGMGEVYRAEDSVAAETVALKVLRPRVPEGEALAERFRDEIRLARKVSHPNICRVNELFLESRGAGRLLFFTMQFLDGPTLAERLLRGPVEPSCALALARQIADGLDAAHRAGIIHRDLKPANVMLVKSSDGSERAVITDFGLARALDAEVSGGQTVAGQVLGTPDYMAPEQFLASPVSPRTDVFSFALLFYEMVAGRRPYPAEDPLRSAIRRTLEPPEPLSRHAPSAPSRWTAVLQSAMAVDPARRHGSAGEMVADLESTVRWRPSLTRRSVLYAAGTALVAGIAVLLRLRGWGTRFPVGRPMLMLTPTRGLQNGRDTGFTGQALDVLLASQLQQSAHVQLLPRERMEQAWQRIRGSAQKLPLLLDPASARDIALRSGAQFVLFGTLSQVSDEFRLDLNLDLMGAGPSEPRKTWRQTLTAKQEADLPSAVFDGANWVRTVLREADADLSRRDRAPAELTTPSWQALQEYARAMDAWRDSQTDVALQHLRAALDLDPDFPLAGARMADLLNSLHRYDDGLPYYSRAAAAIARKNLTDRESLHIRGLFALDTGQLEEADKVFARWCVEYPDEGLGFFYRSTSADLLGFREQALDLIQAAVERDPSSYSFVVRRALLLMDAGRMEEAEAGYRRAVSWRPSDWSDQLRSGLLFNRLDLAGVWEALENLRLRGSPVYRSRAYNFEACLRAEQGQWDEAEKLLHAGMARDEQLGGNGLEGRFTKRRLLVQLLVSRRRSREAVEICSSLLKEDLGHREKMQVGCLLAQAGDVRRARTCVVDGLPQWPVYTHWIKRLQGEIALAEGDPAQAVRLMQAAGQPALKNEWRWYLARAAMAAGDRNTATACIAGLLENPGPYWVQADAAGPGFISWAIAAVSELNLAEGLSARIASLRRALSR